MKKQKSYYPSEGQVKPDWIVVDAEGQILGRLASRVASIVRGKEKPTYTPSVDTGDFVVIINADKIKVTGSKEKNKMYYTHSGYPGGLKSKSYSFLMKTNPEHILHHAIKGMLPKTKLKLINKVKIYKGNVHPHEAQSPKMLELA